MKDCIKRSRIMRRSSSPLLLINWFRTDLVHSTLNVPLRGLAVPGARLATAADHVVGFAPLSMAMLHGAYPLFLSTNRYSISPIDRVFDTVGQIGS